MPQMGDRPVERALAREGPGVHLVDHRAVEPKTSPFAVRPPESVVIDEGGPAEHAVGLRLRPRVGTRLAAVERERVPRATRRVATVDLPPAARRRGHRVPASAGTQLDLAAARRPHPEPAHHGSWRLSTATGKSRTRPSTAIEPPSCPSPVKRLRHLPAGSSTVVSAQSPPRPMTRRGTSTKRRARANDTTCAPFGPRATTGT